MWESRIRRGSVKSSVDVEGCKKSVDDAMTLSELDKFLIDLGFHKTNDEVKKVYGDPFNPRGLERRLMRLKFFCF